MFVRQFNCLPDIDPVGFCQIREFIRKCYVYISECVFGEFDELGGDQVGQMDLAPDECGVELSSQLSTLGR